MSGMDLKHRELISELRGTVESSKVYRGKGKDKYWRVGGYDEMFYTKAPTWKAAIMKIARFDCDVPGEAYDISLDFDAKQIPKSLYDKAKKGPHRLTGRMESYKPREDTFSVEMKWEDSTSKGV